MDKCAENAIFKLLLKSFKSSDHALKLSFVRSVWFKKYSSEFFSKSFEGRSLICKRLKVHVPRRHYILKMYKFLLNILQIHLPHEIYTHGKDLLRSH